MKKSNEVVIRRFDDLGRIVIPIKIRESIFGTRKTENVPVEIVEKDGCIMLLPIQEDNEWIKRTNEQDNSVEYVCSCGCAVDQATNYCPDCGVRKFDLI